MKNQRPHLRIRPQGGDKALEAAGWIILLANWVFVLLSYGHLPFEIPSFYDFMGKVTEWGSRPRIFLLPTTSTLILILITYFNFHPHLLNYPVNITDENAFANYFVVIRFNRYVKLLLAIIFFIVSFRTVEMAHGHSGEIGFWTLPILIIILFIPMTTLIIYMIKKDRTNTDKNQ